MSKDIHNETHNNEYNKNCGCCCENDHEHKHDHDHDHKHKHEHGCGCGHDHEHGEDIHKTDIIKIGVGAILFILALLTESFRINIVLYLAAYFVVGGEVLINAVKNISKGHIFDENFLMSIATIGAFIIGEYPEAVAVMMFYQIGEMFQSYAVGKSRKSITELMDIRPDVAYVKLNDGSVVKREPKDVRIGEIIVVKPGEKVPLDGKLAKGEGSVNTTALTGESLPREVFEGDTIISGSISISGVLEIEVLKEFSESTVSKILELVENAGKKKANTEKFISKFAKYYTPIVVLVAAILGIVPPLFEGMTNTEIWFKWVYRALSFLVISCPCALVISVPLGFFAGIGGASRKGVLIKGSSYLEALAKCSTVVFDKTGTLTKGNFKVSSVRPENDITIEQLLEKATICELFSNHPIALSIKEKMKEENSQMLEEMLKNTDASGYEEISGYGIKAVVNGETIYAGSRKIMDKFHIPCEEACELGTVVYVAREKSGQDAKYLGYIVISDEIKEDAKNAVLTLKEIGINNLVMLTGDRDSIAKNVGGSIGIDKIFSELLPGDKVERLEEIIAHKESDKRVAFVGDGINDAPVLARADIGIAMGGLGQDAAIEAADVVIMDDKPSNIAKAVRTARKTMKIVKQNIAFAIAIKILVLILAAIGIASMWYAVFADVGVCVIAILNALRALK